MKNPIFTENQIYHIYNRGVEKRKIFLENKDYFRFIHDLFEFNDTEPVMNINYYFKRQTMEVEPQYLKKERKPRQLLVEILIFVLMPNHFHLLLKQKRDNGIIKFMQKIGTGYAMYFNKKYERVGSLFQSRFKAVLINKDSHLLHLPFYLHCNPLDIEFPKWREKELKHYKEAVKFLENYRWSSYLDYIGKKNFSSVTQREFLTEFFGGSENYKKETIRWLKEMNLEKIKEIILEN